MNEPTQLRTHLTSTNLQDLEELERTIRGTPTPPEGRRQAPAPRPAPRPPVHIATPERPDMNAHLEDLGRMSAEAVLTQWDATAKEVEDLGIAVKERVKSIATSLIELDGNLKELAETAAAVREKGNLTKLQIEEASTLSNALREACADIRKITSL
jgi:hypothetical protein